MADIAFVGLGVMGWPMARHLVAAGHRLRLYNRTADKAARFAAAYGGTPAASVAVGPTGAKQVTGDWADQAAVGRFIDGLGTQLPAGPVGPAAP